ncbi:nucleoside-diphosphate kinase [Patescibacteria group bacterium]|nr:nucleoside-diphosphate kinase [Patescibacteria group bacterium]MDE1946888.1 nucleoside-diphosphate kinase [Patescibacteria group bacterium]MDE2010708.1 nucleoside-diphosphate kinase [Patescibacteria group bacterium]MDE2232686.1 nucleoside-diphosphate kinase [Patescibacteria group bacterium]
MNTHPKHERTLIIVKPDGIQRGLIGEIINRYERVGLKLTALKMMIPTAEMVEKHYTLDPEWRMKTGLKSIKGYTDKGLKPPHADPLKVTEIVLEKLKEYLTSGPVIAMVWQGAHAAEIVRKLIGGTEPRSSDVGTIRGDFVLDSYAMSDSDGRAVRNLVHASGSAKEAEDEIAHWFKKEEIFDYKLLVEQIIYEKDLDGILE